MVEAIEEMKEMEGDEDHARKIRSGVCLIDEQL